LTSFPYACDKQELLDAMNGRWESFYGQIINLKPYGHRLRGNCPIHNGKDANFEIDSRTGYWQCYSQCQDGGDIFSFVQKYYNKSFPDALRHLAEWVGWVPGAQSQAPVVATVVTGVLPENDEMPPKIVAEYDYLDEGGNLIYQVVRFEPKDFRQRRPNGTGGWTWGIQGLQRQLYRLPEVLTAVAANKTIWIVEGEKDADRLHSLGLCSTSNSGGAQKWLEEYTRRLHGAKVAILSDNDKPGAKHAQLVAESLYPVAAQVRIVELPGLGDKGDVSDFLDAGGTKEDLIRLTKEAPRWAPSEASKPTNDVRTGAYVPGIERLIDLADVPAPPVELPYLFGPYLNVGASHWITGQTGLGKSTLMFNIMTALAEGKELWSIPCEQQTVLYVDAESGDIGRSMKIDRLYGLAPRVAGRLYFARLPFKLPDELEELITVVKEKQVTIVVFDTARRCFAVRDENDNAEVYRSVVPCLDRLKLEGIATVTLGHPPKSGSNCARGAGAQEDAGDINLTLTMHRGNVSDENGVIALRVTKNRLLGMGTPPLYLRRIGDDHFERVNDDDPILKDDDSEEEPSAPGAIRLCMDEIKDMLCEAPKRRATHHDLRAAVMDKGHSRATFGRAMTALREAGDLVKTDDRQWEITDPFSEDATG